MKRMTRRPSRTFGSGGGYPASLRAVSLIETLIVFFALSLALLMAVNFSTAASRTQERLRNDLTLTDSSRRAMDEVLFQVRGAGQVAPSRSGVGSGTTNLVLACPSYNTGTSGLFPGTSDYVTLSYDSNLKQVTETIVPDSSSQRPARSAYVLAKDVTGVTFRYKVREQYGATASGTFSRTLKVTANGTPTAYVDGAAAACTYNSGTNTASVTIPSTSPQRTVDVQFVYEYVPTSSGDTNLVYANEVLVKMQLQRKGYAPGSLSLRTTTLQGTACLRNRH